MKWDWFHFGETFDFLDGQTCFFLNLSSERYQVFCDEEVPDQYRSGYIKLINSFYQNFQKFTQIESDIPLQISSGLSNNKYCQAQGIG